MTITNFLKRLITVISSSFTTIMLAFAILPETLVPTLQSTVILQTFIICVCASTISNIVSFIDFKQEWTSVITCFLSVCIVVFGIGIGIFQIIPQTWEIITWIFISIIIIYSLCYFLLLTKNQSDADKINEMLKHTHSEENHHE